MGTNDLDRKKWTSPHGKRYTCFSCGIKFYDLGKKEVICPVCGTNQMETPANKKKISAKAPRTKLEEPPVENDVIDVAGENADTGFEDLDVADQIDSGAYGKNEDDETEG